MCVCVTVWVCARVRASPVALSGSRSGAAKYLAVPPLYVGSFYYLRLSSNFTSGGPFKFESVPVAAWLRGAALAPLLPRPLPALPDLLPARTLPSLFSPSCSPWPPSPPGLFDCSVFPQFFTRLRRAQRSGKHRLRNPVVFSRPSMGFAGLYSIPIHCCASSRAFPLPSRWVAGNPEPS